MLLLSRNLHLLFSHILINSMQQYFLIRMWSCWKYVEKPYYNKHWPLSIAPSRCWYYLEEEMEREQPETKWLLSLNISCKLGSPWLHWKLVVGGTGGKTQILEHWTHFSRARHASLGLLPISGIGLYVFLFVGLICRQNSLKKAHPAR